MPVILPPWSYTHLDTFGNCAHQYHWKYILKNKEPPTPEMLEGHKVDEVLEKRVAANIALPAQYAKWEPLVGSIVTTAQNSGGQIRTQMKVGINREMKPTDFFAKDVYGRGVFDVAIEWPQRMFIGDWKTGKTREKDFQVMIFAFFGFLLRPEVEKITACNIWLPTLKPGTQYNYDRGELPRMWSEIFLKLAAMENAAARDEWPKRPSPLCGWCPVLECEFNKKEKAK